MPQHFKEGSADKEGDQCVQPFRLEGVATKGKSNINGKKENQQIEMHPSFLFSLTATTHDLQQIPCTAFGIHRKCREGQKKTFPWKEEPFAIHSYRWLRECC